MADRKISDLTALTTPATGDLIPIVDISEAAAADKNKSITVGELLRGAPDGTAAAPGIAFESDGGNGIFLAGTDQVGVATGGVERVEFGASEVVFNDGGADYDFRIEGDTNTALFFVDASTDRIGVGTTSPGAKLSIEEKTYIEGGYIRFLDNASSPTGTAMWRPATDTIAFNTTSTERLRIDSSGRVGIGTSSPDHNVTVANTSSQVVLNLKSSTSEFAGLFFGDTDDAGQGAITYDNSSDQLNFATNRSASVATDMCIDSSGRVGIGTTSPQLSFVCSNGGANGFEIDPTQSTGTVTGINSYNRSSSAFTPLRFNASDHRWDTASTERARIDSAGRLLVGTSSSSTNDTLVLQGNSAGSTFGAQLRLRRNATIGSGTGIAEINFEDGNGNRYAVIEAAGDGTSGSGDYPGRLVFSTTASTASSPTERMRITNDGKLRIGMVDFGADPSASNGGTQFKDQNTGHIVTAATVTTAVNHHLFFNTNGAVGSIKTTGSATSFNTSSDYRLKENVVDIDDGIARLKRLQPRRFNFIADIDTIVDGFIAHEAQAVVPEAVSGTKDEVDENGDAVMQGIDQSKLVPLLTAALKEAIAKIETLEAKVSALEAN